MSILFDIIAIAATLLLSAIVMDIIASTLFYNRKKIMKALKGY